MNENKKIRCHIIGSTTLCLNCASILLERGHTIKSITSNNSKVTTWANQNGVLSHKGLDQAQEDLDKDDYDIIFSIVNDDILKQPKHGHQLIINYHDGLLPKYAGVHATSWSLLNNEHAHGVTWHIAKDKVDAGPILAQATIPITADEKALSLNLKCYESAVSAFKELIKSLESDSIKPIQQDLSKRSCYMRDTKPYANGIICWEHTGEYIERLFRATQFGNYPNTFSTAKLVIDGKLFFPKALSLVDNPTDAPPGTITYIDDECMYVATATKQVSICALTDEEDMPLSMTALYEQFQLYTGYNLGVLNRDVSRSIQKFSSRVNRYEAYWLDTLMDIENEQAIRLSKNMNPHHRAYQDLIASLPLSIEQEQECMKVFGSEYHMSSILFALIIVYLYRINNFNPCTVFYSSETLRSQVMLMCGLFEDHIPFTAELSPDLPFLPAMKKIMRQLEDSEARLTYFKDIKLRYPELNRISTNDLLRVVITDSIHHYQPNSHCPASIVISKENTEILFFSHSDLERTSHTLIRNISGHIVSLLTSFLADPEQPLHKPQILSKHEKHLLIYDWNKTNTNYDLNKSVLHLFEEQVEKNPDRIALIYQKHMLTYRQMNKRANRLAHLILKTLDGYQAQHHPHNPIITVCMERSMELLITFYAILKAGAAYTPLSTNIPPQRFSAIVKNTETPLLITTSTILEAQPFLAEEVECLVLDSEPTQASLRKASITNPTIPIEPQHVAYIIHTSGTTGEPKSVLSHHKGLTNRIQWMQEHFQLTARDVVLHKTPYTFDVSIWELTWPLITGARLVIAEPEMHKDSAYLADIIQHEGITTLHFVPSMLDAFLRNRNLKACQPLERIICSGEALSVNLRRRCQRQLPGASLTNLYGPTEASIDVSFWNCDSNAYPNTVPIGYPIANTQLYVLDDFLNPLPVGCAGELYIGGVNVGHGYLNDIKKTKQTFIPNIFEGDNIRYSLLYKTGDLARRLPDGSIDYIGRTDDQVKIRGLRIEPNAIAHQLLTHPRIEQCVVSTKIARNGAKQLVAYYVLKNESQNILQDELKQHIRTFLPEYMIPHFFIRLLSMPLGVNGKVDRKLLPTPKYAERNEEIPFVAPKHEIHFRLIDIWQSLLEVDAIGVNDSFFDLGGDSLLASELVMKLHKNMNLRIPLQILFENPTVALLGNYITKHAYSPHEGSSDVSAIVNKLSLPKDIQPDTNNANHTLSKPKYIFLTGATGFVGIHILWNLCRFTQSKIYCLVRAKSTEAAHKKLLNAAQTYQLDLDESRIVLMCGDLGKAKLGLTSQDYNELCEKVDAIYHNGALVNHLYQYPQLKSTNVDSVVEILRIATKVKTKFVHYISTIGAATSRNDDGLFDEEFLTNKSGIARLTSGYQRSKWAAEWLMSRAHARGLPCNIFRLPLISGHSVSGAMDYTLNQNFSLIRTCIQLQCAPSWETRISMLPVDFVAQAIVKIGGNSNQSQVYNLCNPNTIKWSRLVQLLQELGYRIDLVTPEKWHSILMKHGEETPLKLFLPLYMDKENITTMQTQAEDGQFTVENARTLLKTFNLVYPRVNKTLLATYLYYLIDHGMLQTTLLKQFTHA